MTALTKPPDVPLDLVEWRVDGKPTAGQNPRARFVPYIGAATIAGLLDEWVGPDGWSDSYQVGSVGGKEAMWCTVAIRKPDGHWVTKTDIGTVSQFEPQKGAVSDSFKRAACLKWGVGRNVYQLPTLWAPCRVQRKPGGDVAWPTDSTLPALLHDLKRLGYGDVDGGRLQQEQPDEDTGEIAPPSPPGTTAPAATAAPPVSPAAAEVEAMKPHAVTKGLHAAGLDTSGSVDDQRARLAAHMAAADAEPISA